MDILLGLIGLAILIVVYLRRWLLDKEIPQQQAMDFDGELYQVGDAVIARRCSANPRCSVIVMPGFMENFLYFTEFYQDPEIELIMLTSGDYHVPVNDPRFQQASWASTPQYPLGTIAYDASVLNQALAHLVSTDLIRVHGHSRGGAVTLEAARQRPDLFEQVEVLLEAPVLPQGKPYTRIPGPALWLMPYLLLLWQQQPISERNRKIWGPLDNPRKRELIMGVPFNPKRCRTMLANLKDMANWMEEHGSELFAHVKSGAILVPGHDRVLQPAAMLASARQAENLQVIEVEGGSHFVTPDHPDSIPPLPA